MSSPSANAIHAVRCILREAGNPLVVVITMIVLRFGRPNAHAHVRRALRSARVERKILRAARGLKAAASVASTRNGPSRCGQGLACRFNHGTRRRRRGVPSHLSSRRGAPGPDRGAVW